MVWSLVATLLEDVVHCACKVQDFKLFFRRYSDVAATSLEDKRIIVRSKCFCGCTICIRDYSLGNGEHYLVLMNLLRPGRVPYHFSIIIDELRTKPSGIIQNYRLSRD